MSAGAARLTPSQERLWFLQRMHPELTAYNTIDVLSFDGPLARDRLRAALGAVVEAHPALRAAFVSAGGEPRQEVEAEAFVDFEVTDAAGEEDVVALARELAMLPFDLEDGWLLRTRLVRTGPRDHLVLVMHHLVVDDWSLRLLWSDLAAAYGEHGTGAPQLPQLDVDRYAAAIRGHRDAALAAEEEGLAFWLGLLEGHDPAAVLRTDRPRREAPSSAGATVAFSAPDAAREAVRAFASRARCPPFPILLATWAAALSRFTGESSVVIGTPAANRLEEPEHEVVGLFANTLPLRLDLAKAPSPAALIAQAREVVMRALDHQQAPFATIVRAVAPARDLRALPLIAASLVVEDIAPPALAGAACRAVRIGPPRVAGELTLNVSGIRDGRLDCWLDYAEDVFDRGTIEALRDEWVQLLQQAQRSPDEPIWRLMPR